MSHTKNNLQHPCRLRASIGSWGVLITLAVIVLALSAWVIWINDDLYFAFYIGGEVTKRLHSLTDVAESQWTYYLTRNGRFVTHYLVQCFCSFTGGQAAFAICNALVWPALVWLIARASGIAWRREPIGLLVIAALAFVSFRTQFSPPCQINYIWAMTATLVIVHEYLHPRTKPSWAICIGLVIFSFLAGWGQESLCSGIAAAMWLYALRHWKQLSRLQWLMLVAYTVGMLFLCLSPGNYAKFSSINSGGLIGGLWITIVNVVMLLRVSYLLLVVVVLLKVVKGVPLMRMYRENAFWWNAMAFMVIFNLLVRVYCNRQLFGIELMSLIIVIRLLRHYPLGSVTFKRVAVAVLTIIAVLVVVEDALNIERRRALYFQIKELFQASSDGVVYCDIPNKDYCYDDHDAMYCFNLWSLHQMKRKWLYDGDDRALQWRPTEAKALRGKALKSQVLDLGDGMYLLVAARNDSIVKFKTQSIRLMWNIPLPGYSNDVTTEDWNFSGNVFYIEDKWYRAAVVRSYETPMRYVGAQLMPDEPSSGQ